MTIQYYFYFKNGITLSADFIKIIGGTVFMYVQQNINESTYYRCICDVPVEEFRDLFKYLETTKNYNANEIIKHYKEA